MISNRGRSKTRPRATRLRRPRMDIARTARVARQRQDHRSARHIARHAQRARTREGDRRYWRALPNLSGLIAWPPPASSRLFSLAPGLMVTLVLSGSPLCSFQAWTRYLPGVRLLNE